MANWCFNTILISGPRKDVSVLYKSLIEYKAEIKSKEKEPDENLFNIGAWIKDKFSDKLLQEKNKLQIIVIILQSLLNQVGV